MTLQEFARAVIYGTPGDDHQLLPFDTPVVAVTPDGTRYHVEAVAVDAAGTMELRLGSTP